MRPHEWFVEHRPDFVARALDAGEAAAFAEHMNSCAECRTAVSRLEHELRWLSMGVDPVPPRAGFTGRVLEAVRPRPHPRRSWLAPAVAAASLLLALGIWSSDRSRMDELERDLAAVRDTLSVLRRANRVLQAQIEMDGKRGGIVLFADETTHRWKVVVHGIPAAPAGERYIFWFITGSGMVRGPDVICDERNPAVFTLDMPPGAKDIKGGALTVEPMDGDLDEPRGRELAHLEL